MFSIQRRALRRWARVQKSLIFDTRLGASAFSFDPIDIINFSNVDDAEDAKNCDFSGSKGGWRLSDDEVIGGFSRATLQLMKYDGFENDNKKNEDADSDKIENQLDRSFLRWEGKIDTRVAKGSQASRSGFCAIRSPDFIFNGINLKDRYNALELTCRVDSRNYTINLKPLSFIPDDLYQGQINHDSSFSSENNSSSLMFDHEDEWQTLVLPFDDFALTAFGRLRAMQRPMREDGVQLINIGLMIADGHDGDFRFDLAKIRAINLGLH
mmetsp:Transcript_23836/g.27464  ORF Transcript_23836/g.27464 Transcript_23836/m.27464 type:complete len:268 (-) Transcript_23836:67-870(-)